MPVYPLSLVQYDAPAEATEADLATCSVCRRAIGRAYAELGLAIIDGTGALVCRRCTEAGGAPDLAAAVDWLWEAWADAEEAAVRRGHLAFLPDDPLVRGLDGDAEAP